MTPDRTYLIQSLNYISVGISHLFEDNDHFIQNNNSQSLTLFSCASKTPTEMITKIGEVLYDVQRFWSDIFLCYNLRYPN